MELLACIDTTRTYIIMHEDPRENATLPGAYLPRIWYASPAGAGCCADCTNVCIILCHKCHNKLCMPWHIIRSILCMHEHVCRITCVYDNINICKCICFVPSTGLGNICFHYQERELAYPIFTTNVKEIRKCITRDSLSITLNVRSENRSFQCFVSKFKLQIDF